MRLEWCGQAPQELPGGGILHRADFIGRLLDMGQRNRHRQRQRADVAHDAPQRLNRLDRADRFRPNARQRDRLAPESRGDPRFSVTSRMPAEKAP